MDIILSPEQKALLTEIEALKAKLSGQIALRDDLLLQVCPQIEAQYMHAVGALECEAYRLECTRRKLRRELELIRSCVNRQEAVDLPEIHATLDKEFVQYQAELEKREAQLRQALEMLNRDHLTVGETAELKQKYHDLVKALHPDLNPDANAQSLAMYDQAVKAYRDGDLGTIRMLHAMLGDASAEKTDSIDELRERRDRLRAHLELVIAHIARIKDSFPYNQQAFLADRTAVASYAEEVRQRVAQEKKEIQRLQALLSEWEVPNAG